MGSVENLSLPSKGDLNLSLQVPSTGAVLGASPAEGSVRLSSVPYIHEYLRYRRTPLLRLSRADETEPLEASLHTAQSRARLLEHLFRAASPAERQQLVLLPLDGRHHLFEGREGRAQPRPLIVAGLSSHQRGLQLLPRGVQSLRRLPLRGLGSSPRALVLRLAPRCLAPLARRALRRGTQQPDAGM